MINLVFINIFSSNEGAEKFLYDLLAEFSKMNEYKITLLDNRAKELPVLEKFERISIRTIERNFHYSIINQSIKCINDINKALKGRNCIVILNGERAMYLAPFLLRSNSYISIKHMSIEGKYRFLKGIALLISTLFCKKIVTISQYHKSILSCFLPRHLKDRIKVIYLGIDCYNRYLPSHQVDKESFTFIIVGSLMERKGHLDLIDAFHHVVNHVNCRLLIAGKGQLEEKLKEIVYHKKLEQYVTFLGHTERIEEIYKKCHAFVLPSYSEGMPLSIMEAFSCELPVISTNIIGIPELVFHNVNGFLIEPGNRENLTKYMIYLAKNTEIAHNMGIEGRKLICSKFSKERMIEDYRSLFMHI